MWFIDKLNVQQTHGFDLPLVGEHGVLRYDIATGEKLSDSPKSKRVEGSYSSAITIRCDGSKVTITGNPSRFNRSENIFGFDQFEQCISVYNQILLENGLPAFSKATWYDYRQSADGTRAQLITDGAMFDHIDWTRNFSVGKGSEIPFIKGLSSQRIGKGQEPYLYANGQTVDWYKGSDYLYKKVYCKSSDLKKHQRKRLKGSTKKQADYYADLINWCDDIGMLREEHSFKQKFLRRKKLCFYGLTKEIDFAQYLIDIETMIERISVMNTSYDMISDKLITENIVKNRQAANATQCVYLKWLHGDDLGLGRSQFYEHKRRLIAVGIDISIPHDLTKSALQIRSNHLVDVNLVAPPAWYQMPTSAPFLRVA